MNMNAQHLPKLPPIVQDIADVLGRERAIFLIGQLPRCYMRDSHKRAGPNAGRSERVILYVPKTLKPDHVLVRILGWHDAERLVHAFGGELLNPPTLRDVIYRPWRDQAIRELVDQGTPQQVVAEWFQLTRKRVGQLAAGVLQEIPQEARRTAANDDAPASNSRRRE